MEAFSNICVIMILVGLAMAIWAVATWAVITVVIYYKHTKRSDGIMYDNLNKNDKI